MKLYLMLPLVKAKTLILIEKRAKEKHVKCTPLQIRASDNVENLVKIILYIFLVLRIQYTKQINFF